LEDSHNGVRSASSAGMMTIMVPDLLAPTDEIRGLCHVIARDLHEVRRLILAVQTAPLGERGGPGSGF
jgi:beta-phosphoglucomutase-like phosphatase (HAD superfamily)